MISALFTEEVLKAAGLAITGLGGYVTKTWIARGKAAAREETRSQMTDTVKEVLKPSLLEFRDDLLKTMNGTYLRTAEARVRFDSLENAIADIKADQRLAVHDIRNALSSSVIK